MKTFEEIKNEIHDISGITDPEQYQYILINGVYFPNGKLHEIYPNLIDECYYKHAGQKLEIWSKADRSKIIYVHIDQYQNHVYFHSMDDFIEFLTN